MKLQDLFVIVIAILVGAAGIAFSFSKEKTPERANVGSSSDNVLQHYPTATKVWVGTGDTEVVASSSARTYLAIANISGATGTPQALYCNVGGRPAVLYEGMVIHASSSETFGLDNLIRGAVRCRFPVAASAVSVIDF